MSMSAVLFFENSIILFIQIKNLIPAQNQIMIPKFIWDQVNNVTSNFTEFKSLVKN